uniref:2Fe-2S ferredoxin-type domain-containing protein n=1 Tax=Rhodosorus marinus TaxID=101924 RepID=A0A7S3A0R8_9RHOD|mmetsp:Transcript_40319/g.160169  ORF Transcript_40319/g.160169 Transcript_40319/m.160169 type:complete len:100 (+) Transcript_40319:196-495(+)
MAFVGGVSGTGLGRTGRKICSRSGNRRVLRAKSYDVEIELDGEDHTIPVKSDETFLEAIENFGLTVDSSCRAGVCMTVSWIPDRKFLFVALARHRFLRE